MSSHDDKQALLPTGQSPETSAPYDYFGQGEQRKPRYCNNKLSGTQCCWLAVAISAVVTVSVILGLVFGLGKKYAQTAIADSDIVFNSMIMSSPTDSGFTVHVVGFVDNRNVLDAKLDATTMYLASGTPSNANVFGHMSFPALTLAGGASTGFDVTAEVTMTDQSAFDTFAIALMNTPSVSLLLKADVAVHAAGLKYSAISLSKSVLLAGFDSFSNPPVQVSSQDIYKGTTNQLFSRINVTMSNPSPVSLQGLGPVKFDVFLGDVAVGMASTPAFSLPERSSTPPAPIEWEVVLTQTSSNKDTIASVMSDYANGRSTPLVMHGRNDSTPHRVLQAAFEASVIPATLPGLVHLEEKLIRVVFANMSTALNSSDALCGYKTSPAVGTAFVNVHLFANNPFNTEITLGTVNFDVTWVRDDQLFVGRQFLANTRGTYANTIAPGQRIVVTQTLCLRADYQSWLFSADGLLDYLGTTHKDLHGHIPWELDTYVNGTLDGLVGEFSAPLAYEQNFITVTLFQEAQG